MLITYLTYLLKHGNGDAAQPVTPRANGGVLSLYFGGVNERTCTPAALQPLVALPGPMVFVALL
jgi:hypothetical protein